jgi:hypothetical protein
LYGPFCTDCADSEILRNRGKTKKENILIILNHPFFLEQKNDLYEIDLAPCIFLIREAILTPKVNKNTEGVKLMIKKYK